MPEQIPEKPVRLSELQISETPDTIPPSNAPKPIGDRRYVVAKFHARGGMGEVWICHDSHLGRDVAVKRLSSSGTVAKQRFLAEAHVTGQLEHPGIVPVHDLGQDEDGRPFYVMKFVRGRSLKQAIQDYYAKPPRGELPPQLQWRRLLEVFVDVCHAVAYAHSRGVLHRDLKPDNVMLGAYGETILLDWGLAKTRGEQTPITATSTSVHTSASATNTEAGSIIGSPLYMPPEMAEGRINDTDERTDIYLLGATLYEILTGRTPREGKSFDDLLSMARTASVVPPRHLRSVPKALNAICLKAMSHEKDDRYASAMDLAGDMQRYMADEPVSAYREGVIVRTWRWAKRHQVALKRVAILAILGIAAWATWSTLRQAAALRAREEARLQIQTFERLTDEARFYAASSDPMAEHAPYFDPAKARVVSQQAMAAASGWGATLDRLPFPEQRAALREEMYELILLIVQDACHSPGNLAGAGVPALLDHARELMPQPSREYYALDAEYLRLVHDADRAAQQENLANDSSTPSTAFDSFLKGEEFRTRSAGDTTAMPQRIDDLQQAIHFYRLAVEQDPKHFWAHFQLGRCYMSTGKLSEAVEALGTCIALRPDAPWGYSARGMALSLMQRFDEAHTDLDRAVQIDPDFRPAVLNNGVAYWLQHRDQEALRNFSAVLLPPDDRRLIEAAYYRAQIYLANNDTDRAFSDLSWLIDERPDFYPAYLLRARVQMMRGAQDSGLEDLNAVVSHDTGSGFDGQSADDLGERGRMLRRIAAELPSSAAATALNLARQDLESAVRLNAQSVKSYRELGAVYDRLGQSESAVAAYSSALKLSPVDVRTLLDRGWLLVNLKRFDDARADFSAAIAADASNAEAHAGLGYVAACQGDYAEAQDQAAAALLYGSDDYLILHDVACIYAQMYQTDLAHQADHQALTFEMLEKAVALWRAHGTGPDELRLIKQEPAFPPSLRQTAEFQRILGDKESSGSK
jgi:tetratricopeptide (TPR) repeat protein/tRNA A-37 threonylcarbamoyl transferase component Bud32